MDIKSILNRARSQLRVVNAPLTATTMLQELGKMPEAMQANAFIRDRQGGFLFIFRSDTAGDYVLEVVQSGTGQDNVATLYAPDPIFNDRTKVMALRKDLISALESRSDAGAGQLGATDHQRGREVLLGELSTAQLLGMLEEAELGAKVLAASESRA